MDNRCWAMEVGLSKLQLGDRCVLLFFSYIQIIILLLKDFYLFTFCLDKLLYGEGASMLGFFDDVPSIS